MGKVKKPGKKDKGSKKDEVLGVTRSGTVITEELAEQWADGRPSLGPKGLSPRVSFRVPPDLYEAAWARADKEGRSLSELAREAFNQYMDMDS